MSFFIFYLEKSTTIKQVLPKYTAICAHVHIDRTKGEIFNREKNETVMLKYSIQRPHRSAVDQD